MNPLVLYTTAALMALVGVFCGMLFVAWSIPSWRRRLAGAQILARSESGGLTGWPARVGSVLVSVGIAACAVAGCYGCYCALAALSVGSR